ncbi:MAG: hypothetical protein EU542_03315 [Promethearchaeota archaeon]|jgi:hypothetical protein|nr:MAG: hypothetical protein EU542_03315 [Candidatus Lokiarchaeota archaeon]
MKKQYIILAVAIVLLVVSLVFLPIIGEILFIPFVYIFQYSCRSSNRREDDQQRVQQSLENQPNIPLEVKKAKLSKEYEKRCNLCGANISKPNLRYCESCGAKL